MAGSRKAVGKIAVYTCRHAAQKPDQSIPVIAATLLLAACGSVPMAPPERVASERGREVAIYAMSLIDTGYRFGGKNPEAGLDCSGMVAYIFEQAAGLRVSGSAADIAKLGRPKSTGAGCCRAIWSSSTR